MRIVLSSIFFLLSIAVYAQELPVTQLYLHNLYYLNPACAGQDYCTKFYLTDRHQWLGIPQAPSTQVLGIEHSILPNPYKASRKYGLTLDIISDRNGAVKQSGGQAGYSFHTRLNKKKNLFLSFGLRIALLQHSINESNANVENDPVLGAGESALLPDASAGMFIYHPKFYAGFSAARLLPSVKHFYERNTSAFLPGNFHFLVGYKFLSAAREFSLNPSILLKMDQQLNRQIDLNTIAGFGSFFQAGISYRQSIDNIPGNNTGMQFLVRALINRIQVTYIAEINLNQTQSSHFGSHELGLIYKICYREKLECPTFE